MPVLLLHQPSQSWESNSERDIPEHLADRFARAARRRRRRSSRRHRRAGHAATCTAATPLTEAADRQSHASLDIRRRVARACTTRSLLVRGQRVRA